ncbi:MAG: TolC family protein [Planctomycetes bacterium]|nr:TolC family protein [Planctomycetota bacterium]MCB9935610.1 TolC family protein [Planctomycetota bacterium]
MSLDQEIAIKSLISLAALAALLAGCQGYDPMPLDPEAHLQSWHERDPASESVVAYAARLAERDSRPRGKYDLRDGVSLPEAEVIALFFNPELRSARLHADAELAGAREAGRWEDPELSVDAMWIIDSIAHPWILGAGISFTIPFSGSPGVREDLAFAEHDVAIRSAIEREWEIVVELRQAWNEHAAVSERIALTQEYITQVEKVKQTADRLTAAGELTSLDARMFALELAARRAELLSLRADRRGLELTLRELLGLSPEAPLRLNTEIGAESALPADRPKLVQERSPLLAVKRAEYEVAEQQFRLEIHKQYPDLSIGPSYEIEEGQSRIGIGFGLPIPIINLNKEGIARSRAKRLAVRAEFEGELERLLHRLARAEARLEAAHEQHGFITKELAPLADEQVADAQRLAELGEFNAMVQLDALTRRFEARLQVLQATLTEAQAREEVLALLGPTFKPEPQENEDD